MLPEQLREVKLIVEVQPRGHPPLTPGLQKMRLKGIL